ncbi:glycoside hydrolase family 27 protein [Flagellimonas pacifica]|uniref:Alpha-galactosidase n=1 Tax=Flagellimonas pacifica TaxID=1247520 RepID=A0A285N203_9FLAO|nr:glycoside hydrolase family 27 protein [Allomuricauda parva]SNZ01761.1 alpha-galactosidase [Allomuricauda parva]
MKKLICPICIIALISCNNSPKEKKSEPAEMPVNKEKLLAPTPPMGWNSWNWFGKKDINEKIMYEVIDAIDQSGLKTAGYEYVVIDGGWRDTKLGENGALLAHPVKFPNGIKPLADYAHSKGLKFGLHTVPGTADCINDPVGGYGNEEVQIQQFVDWGIDFVKIDRCRFEGGWDLDILHKTYAKWKRLLEEKSDRDVLISISAYEWFDWNAEIGQMARTTEDISAKVSGMSGNDAQFDGQIPEENNAWGLLTVMEIAEENNKWATYAGNGYWNDPDMLVTGEHGLTFAEQKSHFALWCIMSSPLMLGNDPRNMSEEEKSIILNKDAISINQDPTEQGKRIIKNTDTEVWAKNLKDNQVAVLLLNRNQENKKNIALNLEDVGIFQKINIKDVYAGKDIGTASGLISHDTPPKSSLFLLLSKTVDQ